MLLNDLLTLRLVSFFKLPIRWSIATLQPFVEVPRQNEKTFESGGSLVVVFLFLWLFQGSLLKTLLLHLRFFIEDSSSDHYLTDKGVTFFQTFLFSLAQLYAGLCGNFWRQTGEENELF